MFTLSGYMSVSIDTLTSLQILRARRGADIHTWRPDANGVYHGESLSIFGLFKLLAVTPQGKARLRQIFFRPTTDLNLLVERQRTISSLLLARNFEVVKSIGETLRKIRNMSQVLRQLQRGAELGPGKYSFDKSIWVTLQIFASSCLKLREHVQQLVEFEELEVFHKVSLHIQVNGKLAY